MLNNFLIIRAVSITIDFWTIKKSIEIDCAFSGYTPIGVLGYDISSISDNLARKSVSFDIYKMEISGTKVLFVYALVYPPSTMYEFPTITGKIYVLYRKNN